EAVRFAKASISLKELEIEDLRSKRALTGALIFEVRGRSGAEKTDRLHNKLEIFRARDDVTISRLTKTAEIRVTGLDDSATVEEVAESLAKAGGCVRQDIKVGDIRRQPNGLGSCWAKCPVAATALPSRGLQCFKCLEPGHVQAHCTSAVTRTGRCYLCEGLGHLAKNCEAEEARCPACEALGRPHRHRIGGGACTAVKKGKKGGQKQAQQPP
ncbi:hypothetical protein ALC57_07006, partial [Trachymyrmex cornetzi]